MPTRRKFLTYSSFAAMGSAIFQVKSLQAAKGDILNPHMKTSGISCQQYTWMTFLAREDYTWGKDRKKDLALFSQTGLKQIEPLYSSLEEVQELGKLFPSFTLKSPSLYVNSVLHIPEEIEKSVERVLKIATESEATIIVTNPKPIDWNGGEDKTDAQLILQAKALDALGKKLTEMGKVLAYHNHDAEMRQSAREFHHMLAGTDPDHVKLCLDSHWIYRGSGNSQVALFDIVKMYGDRIVELHLRQSQEGIWTETFGEGDVDYPRLVAELVGMGKKPHLVLEQAVEKGTPQTLSSVEAQKRSIAYIEEVFEPLM